MASETRAGDVARATKLRNSCDACATSKIKCTQEKPACTYCVKRSRVCVYGASKRVRRSPRTNTHKARENCVSRTTMAATTWTSPMPTALESNGSYSALGSMTSTDFTSSQNSAPTTPLPGQDWPDFLAIMFPTSPPEPSTSAEWINLGASIDSFPYLDDSTFDFSIPLSGLDQNTPTNRKKVVNPSILNDGAPTNTNNNTLNSFIMSNGSLSKDIHPFPTETQTDAFASSSSLGNSPRMRRGLDDRCTSTTILPVPRCHCLKRTLRFLAQLAIDPSEAWTASENGDDSTQKPNFEQKHDQIENMSTEIGKILHCSCCNNCDLLFLLSLVIFKIQGWYAAAVNAATSDDNESGDLDGADANPTGFRPRLVMLSLWTGLDGEESEGEDQRRIFVQHVLSRLTGLQILISRLSQRLANAEAESCRGATLTTAEGKISVLPFSASLLRALSSDLRDRLCGLSRAIAEKLRVS
jgi:hypothetical protein